MCKNWMNHPLDISTVRNQGLSDLVVIVITDSLHGHLLR